MKHLDNMKTGLAVGFLVTTFSILIFNGVDYMSLQLVGWCIASAIYGGSSFLFEIENLKHIYAFAIHYVICLITTAVMVGIFYSGELIGFVYIFVYFTVIYIAIYAVILIAEKKQVKKINEHLNKKI